MPGWGEQNRRPWSLQSVREMDLSNDTYSYNPRLRWRGKGEKERRKKKTKQEQKMLQESVIWGANLNDKVTSSFKQKRIFKLNLQKEESAQEKVWVSIPGNTPLRSVLYCSMEWQHSRELEKVGNCISKVKTPCDRNKVAGVKWGWRRRQGPNHKGAK